MNGDKFTTELIPRVCPICNTTYQTPKDAPAPTCGNPNCIREARARGLPIVSEPAQPEKKPELAKKRTGGKARKSRS